MHSHEMRVKTQLNMYRDATVQTSSVAGTVIL